MTPVLETAVSVPRRQPYLGPMFESFCRGHRADLVARYGPAIADMTLRAAADAWADIGGAMSATARLRMIASGLLTAPPTPVQFADFYRRMQPKLVHWLRPKCRGLLAGQEEDIVQAAMLALLLHWDRVGPAEGGSGARAIVNPEAYLYQTVRRLYVDFCKQAAKTEPVAALVESLTGQPHSFAEDVDLQLALKAMLTPAQYEVAALMHITRLDAAEIAELLGKPRSTVYSLWRHAKVQLRAHYLPAGHTEAAGWPDV